jgi:hypothetical protein
MMRGVMGLQISYSALIGVHEMHYVSGAAGKNTAVLYAYNVRPTAGDVQSNWDMF